MNRVTRMAMVAIGGLAVACQARAADGPGASPKVWAIVVGVDRYRDSLIPPCTGSARDARAVADWLENTAGWKGGSVLRMDDLGREQHGDPSEKGGHLRPTLANLEWAIEGWLAPRVKKDDIVVLYFAGQSVAKGPRPGSSAGRTYLLPIDARGGDVHATGWSLEKALDKAKGLAGQKARVVIWLDTSPLGRGQAALPAERGAPTGQDWLRALTRWPGVTAWLAADGRPAPDDGSFVAALRKASGSSERAHNLVGTLRGMLDDPAMLKQGFRTMGGVGPGASLWSGGALVVEEAEPELIAQAGHGDRVTSVLVTADNSRMITAGADSTVRVWSMADRTLDRVLTDPLVGVESLALDRDGALLIAGDGLGRLTGWDMTFDRPKSFAGPTEHLAGIAQLAFLPGGKRFVALDRAKRAILWDASGGGLRKVRDLTPERLSLMAQASRPEPGTPVLVAAVEPVEGGPGRLLGFDAQGNPLDAKYPVPGGRISALDLSDDGRRLVAGDDDGQVVVLELPARNVASQHQFDGAIRLARLSKSETFLVADSASLRLVEPRSGGSSVALIDAESRAIPGEVDRPVFSTDGRWLAARTSDGRALLWRLTGPSKAEAVSLPGEPIPALSPAFSPDSRTLLIGDALGGLEGWDLEEPVGKPRATPRPSIAPSRGRVASLAPSRSGRYLLEITKRDDLALVWDLEQGRGCRPLPGSWVAGSFLPDESKIALIRRPDEGGDLVIFDRAKGQALPIKFAPPPGVGGRPSNVAFGSLAVSKSGKWVAAAGIKSQKPLACVWRVDDGKLVHVARDHDDGVTAVDFSGDEAYLLTASTDGTARVWPMDDPDVELHHEVAVLRNPSTRGRAITSARFSPADPSRVVTGSKGGDLYVWEWANGKRPRRVDLGRSDGEVNASTFSTDGRWLAASWSLGKSVRFWPIAPGEDPKAPAIFPPQPHHGEQVGALAAWPDGSMIVSGGDDSALKFWNLGKRSLVGTLVAQARDNRLVDWLVYTPEGLFDGSQPGEAMVKWRIGEKVVTLEQSQDRHHTFQLARELARGIRPDAPKLESNAPRLRFDDPGGDRASMARQVALTIWTGDADPSALRLYQDGIPVRGGEDFQPGPGPDYRTTTVTLRPGENRFYAMAPASKPGVIDGRSDDLTLRYNGVEPSGRVHVLALGISRYERRPLKYAHVDARRISEYLHSQGVKGLDSKAEPGEEIVLTDDEVTPTKIDDAFRRLRDAVAKQPDDTVVLFLAGHTDTDLDANQFCLLLPRFPFEPAAPAALNLAARGVAPRGVANGGGLVARVDSPDVLPYSVLYNRLARLDALQRLVIIDACQAGAILEDSAVQNLQRVVDRGSRKARNSYLLAARRGEPANEADALEHGLLTYTLLRGMGAPGLKSITPAPGPNSADLNGDGLVTSDELAAYTDDVLPRLALMFPDLVKRAGNNGPGPVADPGPAGPPSLEGRMKIQSADASFPLIAVPKPR